MLIGLPHAERAVLVLLTSLALLTTHLARPRAREPEAVPPPHEWFPAVTADAQGFAVAWDVGDHAVPFDSCVQLARLDAAGNRLGALTSVSVPARDLDDVRIAWSGSVHGVVFRGHNRKNRDPRYEIYFAAVSPDGRVRVAPMMLSGARAFYSHPRITWRDGAFSVAWVEPVGPAGIWLGRLREDGRWLDPPRRIHDEGATELELAAHGGRDVVAWLEPRAASDPATLRWLWPETATAPRRASRLVRTTDAIAALQLAPTASGVSTFWIRVHVDVAMALEHATVTPELAAPVFQELHRGDFMSALGVAANPSMVMLAWTAFRERQSGIAVAALANGTLLAPPHWHGAPGHARGAPELAWGAAGWGAAWLEVRDGGTRVYFARVAPDGSLASTPRPVSE